MKKDSEKLKYGSLLIIQGISLKVLPHGDENGSCTRVLAMAAVCQQGVL